MARDGYYRALLYVDIALLYANFLVSAWFVGSHPVPWWAFVSRGWSLERERLARVGRPALTVHNEILQCAGLTLALASALIAVFGPVLVPFIVIHHLFAWYGLTQANYVQHYGLLRATLADGRYEPPAPRHSWNTNHLYSNMILFHLQRHSDHHANAPRPYQVLRDVPGLPRLPSAYPGCFGLAAIPGLWFKVMDPRLMDWGGGDIRKINVDPAKKERLAARLARAR